MQVSVVPGDETEWATPAPINAAVDPKQPSQYYMQQPAQLQSHTVPIRANFTDSRRMHETWNSTGRRAGPRRFRPCNRYVLSGGEQRG